LATVVSAISRAAVFGDVLTKELSLAPTYSRLGVLMIIPG